MTYPYSYERIKDVFEELNDRGLLNKEFFKTKDEDFQIDYLESKKLCVGKRKELKEARRLDRIGKLTGDKDLETIEEEYEETARTLQESINQLLEDLTKVINSHSFHLNYKTAQDPKHIEDKNRKVFQANDKYTIIASRLINNEIKDIYKTETPDRNAIVRDLVAYLKEPIPKIIIRADIKSFFESISFERLIKELEGDGYVSHKSMKLLKNMSYRMKEDDASFIPRGMSFTSSLSEFYLRDIDRNIRNLRGVYFYRRYVDDMIVLANPQEYSNPEELFNEISKIVESKNKKGEPELHLHTPNDHDNKYKAITINYNGNSVSFNYLGYNIKVGETGANVSLRFTDSKINDYKHILDNIFNFYGSYVFEKSKKYHVKKQLYRVLKYLTKNYRLGGSKHTIISGIYFNHRNLTDLSCLDELDKYLSDKVEKVISEDGLRHKKPIKDRLYIEGVKNTITKYYSFRKGFEERQMCKMPSVRIHNIKRLLQWLQRKGN